MSDDVKYWIMILSLFGMLCGLAGYAVHRVADVPTMQELQLDG